MRDVAIIGIGQTQVDEHWELGLCQLALQALQAAMADAGVEWVDALYVGNMLSGELTGQEHLGALIADFAGLRGIEALRLEAAGASGAAALRMGYLAVGGGWADIALVVGVEKMTDAAPPDAEAALMAGADADHEAAHGLSFAALNALLMRRYMHQFGYQAQDFGGFPINAHANAMNNPCAMFHIPLKLESYARARMIAPPVNLMDSAAIGDGAAAAVLVPTEWAQRFSQPVVRIAASAVGTDSVALHDRRDPLLLEGVALSARRAYEQVGIAPDEIDFFELYDSFSITAAMSLEAAGFCQLGMGARMALDGEITLQGRLPISTMGGLKGRGNPGGATGVYQIVEAVQQLRGQAGPNQVPDARWGMTQSIGGSGGTAITHILERVNS
ncbi:MAG: thiolase domain-containing protein [Anaerolineae bacterium]|nr:thiolase domain-containing protein [Anaerolineae bacterium]